MVKATGRIESLIILQVFTWSTYIHHMPASSQPLFVQTEMVPAHKPLTFWLRGQAEKDYYNS